MVERRTTCQRGCVPCHSRIVELSHLLKYSARIMSNVAIHCHRCGSPVQLLSQQKISRRDTCSHCDADLHCCRNCRFFDPGKHDQCAETQAEWVSEKERADFCDYFEPRTSIDLVNRSASGTESTRDAFDALQKEMTSALNPGTVLKFFHTPLRRVSAYTCSASEPVVSPEPFPAPLGAVEGAPSF